MGSDRGTFRALSAAGHARCRGVYTTAQVWATARLGSACSWALKIARSGKHITGSCSAEPEPRRAMETPTFMFFSHFFSPLLSVLCTATQPLYNTRSKLSPLYSHEHYLRVCGHHLMPCVCCVCVRECARVCTGLRMCVLALGRASLGTAFLCRS